MINSQLEFDLEFPSLFCFIMFYKKLAPLNVQDMVTVFL